MENGAVGEVSFETKMDDSRKKMSLRVLIGLGILVVAIISVIAIAVVVSTTKRSENETPAWLIDEEDESVEIAPEMSAEEIAQSENYAWGEDGEVLAVDLYCENDKMAYVFLLDNSYSKIEKDEKVESGRYETIGDIHKVEIKFGNGTAKYENGALSTSDGKYECIQGVYEEDD